MSTINGTTVRTITAKNGYLVPATADQRTELTDLPICECVYSRLNGWKVSRATLSEVFAAMRDSSAVVVLYVGADGGQDARVLWPFAVSLTKANEITCRAYCTLRREIKSFRLDRMLTCHPLTTPDDMEEAEQPEPHADFEDSIAGRNYR